MRIGYLCMLVDIANKQQAIFYMLARFGEAMSSAKRLKIISLLSEVPIRVEQLADLTDQSMAATSAHLRHIDLKDLKMRVDELAGDRPILAYCRGPYCITALKGITSLRELGIPAQRLPFGVPEWKAAGLPLDGISLGPSKGEKKTSLIE